MHGYQNRAAGHVIQNPKAGLFMEMGLGKTVSALTAFSDLVADFAVDTMLVIAPKRVAEHVWSSEVQNWAHLRSLRVQVVKGSAIQRKRQLKEKADVYTISRDNVAWLCAQYGFGRLPFDMLVVDESSSFKNPNSVRFKALKKVAPFFKRVVILTGTPTPKNMTDVWAQIYLLDQGQRLGKFITTFRENYFIPGARAGDIVYEYKPKKDKLTELYNKIGELCMSMKASDYLQLPGRIEAPVYVPMGEQLGSEYAIFERDQVLSMFQDTEPIITAANAAALSNKLLQFCNGAVYDDTKKYHEIHTLKLDALAEIVEAANGSPVLVAYSFISDKERIMKTLKSYKPVALSSNQDIEDWNAGKIQVMVMHPASGGHGLNLQKGGHNIVWFAPTWSLELDQQFNARLDRQGQTHPVVIHRIMTDRGIEAKMMKALGSKADGQEALMQAVKDIVKKYI